MLADHLPQSNGITRTDSEDQPSSRPLGPLVKEALVRRVFTNRYQAPQVAAPFKQQNFLPPTAPAEKGMEPDDLLCSRNARPPKALVGRAQWKINQPPSLKRERASLDRLCDWRLFNASMCGLTGTILNK